MVWELGLCPRFRGLEGVWAFGDRVFGRVPGSAQEGADSGI